MTFHANLLAAGVDERVTHVRKMSDVALDDVEGDIDLLYIDGAHCSVRPVPTSSSGASGSAVATC